VTGDPRTVRARVSFLAVLDRYVAAHPMERACVDRMRAFVRTHADCFERSCRDGHLTGSAWVLSPDHARVLLVHHRKLGRWLQPGGHADGEVALLRVAQREAREESGLANLTVVAAGLGSLPLDLDVHAIPARDDEAAHTHYDVRYLLVARGDEPLLPSPESHAVRWVPRDRLTDMDVDDSVLRLDRKAGAVLPAGG